MYTEKVPKAFLSYIDEKRNCEDIAMAYVVAREVSVLAWAVST
jgi:Glycosyl transferase family 64 domain